MKKVFLAMAIMVIATGAQALAAEKYYDVTGSSTIWRLHLETTQISDNKVAAVMEIIPIEGITKEGLLEGIPRRHIIETEDCDKRFGHYTVLNYYPYGKEKGHFSNVWKKAEPGMMDKYVIKMCEAAANSNHKEKKKRK